MKYIFLVLLTYCLLNIGCSQGVGPGYSLELFRNTPNFRLAKAVINEDTGEIRTLIRIQHLNIDLQETKYGNTLLLLAVENDKPLSTQTLLESGANINISNSENYKPIHEATHYITLKSHSLEILRILIKYGANVNDTATKLKGSEILNQYVPLIGACQNLECAKLLIQHGANPNIKFGGAYPVWRFFDGGRKDEKIFFLRYLIIEKKMSIPKIIDYALPDSVPQDFTYFLNKEDLSYDPKKEAAKDEILNYLAKGSMLNVE